MTRKRFVKLLMSRGYERNTAHYYAHKTMKSGYSYQRVYNEFPSEEKELKYMKSGLITQNYLKNGR